MSKSAKAEQYARELDSARLRGDWLSDLPTQSGKSLPWSELIRKFTKHNPTRAAHANLASTEQQLKLALHNFLAESDYSDQSHTVDFKLSPSKTDTTVFPPYLKPGETGVGWSTDRVEELADQVLEFKGDGKQRVEAISSRALALFYLGRDEDAVDILHREKFMESAGAALDQYESGESYQVALVLQGYTIYGMANERLYVSKKEPGYLPFALAGYTRAMDLHETARGGKRANALRGLPADEIERWAEVALYRHALLCVRAGDSALGLNALRAYGAHASRWPNDLRLPQRNVIYRYYLGLLNSTAESSTYLDPPALPNKSTDDWRSRAFQQSVTATIASRVQIRDYESERINRDTQAKRAAPAFSKGLVTSRTVSKRRPAPWRALRAPSVSWSNETLTVQRAAAASLQKATDFPKAGEINSSVLDFADELVRGWELNGEMGGEQADDVIEILYSLVGVTFQSQRIARHLVRLLFVAESYDEARRALDSYVQIVEKSRAAGQGSHAQEQNGADVGIKDVDDDRTYVQTLIMGAHYVGRYCKDYTAANTIAQKALDLVQQRKVTEQSLVALVMRVNGATRAALAIQLADPSKRPSLQAEALSLLNNSIQLDGESSEAYFQLSYLQAELRDIPSAISSARKALELEPADVESWHLLALLLSAQKKYKDAFKIAEAALSEAEADDKATKHVSENGVANGNGLRAGYSAPGQLLSVDFPPRRSERNESIVRLMLTSSALEEIVDGVESAVEGQKEIFAFFHQRFPSAAALGATASSAVTRASISDARPSIDGPDAPSVRRYGSLAALTSKPNGAGVARSTTSASSRLRVRSAAHQRERTVSTLGANGRPPAAYEFEGVSSTSAERTATHLKHESNLLATIWLASAASFRRAGKLNESRTAIQEAESLEPGLADVWVQLALYFVEKKEPLQAINTLYKALACSGDHVAASVHLARLFLTNADIKPKTAHDAPSPEPRVEPQASAMDGTRSRSISATPQANSIALGGSKSKYSSAAEASLSKNAQDLSSVSLAEGLLNNVTKGTGWDVSEAWLFLGQAVQKSRRTQRARECLEYALALENTKPIRPLEHSLRR